MKSRTSAHALSTDKLTPKYIDEETTQKQDLPAGPLGPAGGGNLCALLIFVPRNKKSAVINDLTGGYGYSHLAIDCGEVDIPTGKRVMVESTEGVGVHNSFQDEYGDRKFVRIPLEKAGVETVRFCDCVRSKLGEKFDYEEALTIGLIHDPAKQICSDLATACLPETIRKDISRRHRFGWLHTLSALRLYEGPKKIERLFVTPNGFAQYFGAPQGGQLAGPDQLSEPKLPSRQAGCWLNFWSRNRCFRIFP